MKENFDMETLSHQELTSINGGVAGTLMAVATLLGGATLLAYGAGYIYGKYLCECE